MTMQELGYLLEFNRPAEQGERYAGNLTRGDVDQIAAMLAED